VTIVLPIIFLAACLGLFVKRVTPAHWGGLALAISLVIAYHFLKAN